MKHTFNDIPFDPNTEQPYLKEDGVVKFHYSDGSLLSEIPYKDGQENGVAKIYFPDGTLEWETPYKDGQVNGALKRYSRDGSLEEGEEWYYGANLSDKEW